MSIIKAVLSLVFPEKREPTEQDQSHHWTVAGTVESPKKVFGERIAVRKFKPEKAKWRRSVTLSQSQRHLNRLRWEAQSSVKPSAQANAAVQVTVQKLIHESDDMVVLELALNEGQKLAFKAGQFLTCHFKVPNANGELQELRRAYSLAAAPSSGRYLLAIKLLPNGLASEFVHQQLKVGDQFSVSGPSGDFVVQSAPGTRIFIAGGSGITPIKSQIEELLAQGCDDPMILIYANRTQRSMAFKKHFAALEKNHPNLSVTHVLSQPKAGWKGLQGRLNEPLLDDLIKQIPALSLAHEAGFTTSQFYLCGAAGFVETGQTLLRNLQVPVGNIQHETFLPAASATAEHPQVAQQIHFLRSGKKVTAEPGETILAAGLRAGVPLQSSCQVGGCGHCKITVRSGAVLSDEPNCLTAEEAGQGLRLACLSYATSALEVDA